MLCTSVLSLCSHRHSKGTSAASLGFQAPLKPQLECDSDNVTCTACFALACVCVSVCMKFAPRQRRRTHSTVAASSMACVGACIQELLIGHLAHMCLRCLAVLFACLRASRPTSTRAACCISCVRVCCVGD